ncbi:MULTISPECIES: hypothetical protein [Methylobacterium]|uniref:hypothetical protein n=2 Tax=Methylobacteriaceae TaxID=119045 RepID=UPI00089F3920|nr:MULTISPECIES: hypothetical protein [Methylobacterium]MBN4097367.1 hypothetical protein [Methylobacterium sp. OT2]UIN35653.1 hypothetical protein LXM90_03930 [Methylobacterium oryzae]SEF41775.1 hypothetical protein SAMN04488144_101185 [Methylobacterium sp. 190mf]
MPGLRLGLRPASARAAGWLRRAAPRPAGASLYRPGSGKPHAPAPPRAALGDLTGTVTLVPGSRIQQVLNTGRMLGHAEQAGQPVGDAPENGIGLLVIVLALYDDETHLRTRMVRSGPQLDTLRRVAWACRKSSDDYANPHVMNVM